MGDNSSIDRIRGKNEANLIGEEAEVEEGEERKARGEMN